VASSGALLVEERRFRLTGGLTMDVSIGGISLVVIIFGLVEFIKKFGLKGNWLTAVSMVVGISLGVLYQVSLKYTIVNEYFQYALFGLACGLAACGLYDFAKNSRNASQ
jgi:hypothetical protein